MSLTLRARLAARNLDVELEVGRGKTLGLLGGNGSGKSTTLDVLAGLVRPDSGQAWLDGTPLFRLDPPRRRWLPPHARPISLLAQDPLLFPHLNVVDNVAFGPRSRGLSRSRARTHAEHWLAEVEAGDLTSRRPTELSGGQQQRVALARALATEPALLLLDEPLSATDVDLAAAMRQTLRRVLADRTAIIVTHQILDAVLLSDQVAVMEDGRVAEHGATDHVLRHPRTRFAASLSGLNMLHGTVDDDGGLRTPDGVLVHGQVQEPLQRGQSAIAIFRPVAVSVHTSPPTGSPRNHFVGTVTAIEPQSHLVRVHLGALSADITAESVARLDLAVGSAAGFVVKAAEVTIYAA